MSALQGLDRGLRALDLVSASPDGLSIAALAGDLGVDRAIAYRIVATLEAHGLVARDATRRVRLGAGVMTWAGRFLPHLVQAAEPALQALADEVGAPAFLSIAQGSDTCVPVLEVQPRGDTRPLRVSYRIGRPHPLTRGAAGLAILALHPARPGEPSGVAAARERGYAATSGELQEGAHGVAVGFEVQGLLGAAVSVVTMDELDHERVGLVVRRAAEALRVLGAT